MPSTVWAEQHRAVFGSQSVIFDRIKKHVYADETSAYVGVPRELTFYSGDRSTQKPLPHYHKQETGLNNTSSLEPWSTAPFVSSLAIECAEGQCGCS